MPENDFAYMHPNSPLVSKGAKRLTQLGVTATQNGVDISVVAPHATAIEVCFFSSKRSDARETRFQLLGPEEGIWHGHISGIAPGTLYGLRAWGPWDPDHGHLYNPHKLLLDPYAKAISGKVEYCAQTHAHQTDSELYPEQPLQMNVEDSAPYTVRGVVSGPQFPIAPGPNIPWNETVIYEAHVRGLTEQLPGIPESLRGTYAGLAHPTTISYLKDLGVTTIELLPIHAKLNEPFLMERGLDNYWGYSTLSYFAPEPSYATKTARQVGPLAVLDEFRGMVSLLHQAGLEIILDVVYNHTCEGATSGQSISWRGLDNAMYYRLCPDNQSYTMDFSGCGNTLDMSHPRVTQMVLDSLRYWAGEVGVDGFRFDLGVAMGRMRPDFTPDHSFFQTCLDDPILRDKKMIAEPWDLGPNGWRTGDFPLPFSTWNDRYRDAIRSFWLADARAQSRGDFKGNGPYELATRLSGSEDLYGPGNIPGPRGPRCSINFVTAHDGFTMADLVCYDHKHNEANLENNRDGNDNNLSWNHGVEGSSRSHPRANWTPAEANESLIADLQMIRERSLRNLMGTLLLSAGTPMIVAGDEFARSQNGNNNAYCQDNEISWLDWNWSSWQENLHDSIRYLLRLRKEHPTFRPASFLTGKPAGVDQIPDLSWYDQVGSVLQDQAWHSPTNRVLQMLRSGAPYGDQDLLVLFNGVLAPATVTLAAGRGQNYQLVYDTSWQHPNEAENTIYQPEEQVKMEDLSIQIYLTQPV